MFAALQMELQQINCCQLFTVHSELYSVQKSGRIALGVLTSHCNLTPTSLSLSVYLISLPVRISVLLLSSMPLI